ncbi:MAG TPA: family 16 glycoside hydrolase [Ktedonobacteraceae bacterium]|nr:family 16 glycoside hydrolase [Ktedonobacteraceae bacterium]
MRTIYFRAMETSFLTSCLLLLLAACSSGPTVPVVKSPIPTPTATPTPLVKAGTVLYQADWSHDLAGWQGSGWNAAHGQVVTTSDSTFTITAPYQPVVHNYAIEVQIQISKLFRPVGGYFIIFAKSASGRDGFQASVNRFMEPGPRPNGTHPDAQIFTDPSSSMAQGDGIPRDYEPLDNWHTYRIEVQDMVASFSIDGTVVSSTTSTVTPTLSTGPIGITCTGAILTVKDFHIIAL